MSVSVCAHFAHIRSIRIEFIRINFRPNRMHLNSILLLFVVFCVCWLVSCFAYHVSCINALLCVRVFCVGTQTFADRLDIVYGLSKEIGEGRILTKWARVRVGSCRNSSELSSSRGERRHIVAPAFQLIYAGVVRVAFPHCKFYGDVRKVHKTQHRTGIITVDMLAVPRTCWQTQW